MNRRVAPTSNRLVKRLALLVCLIAPAAALAQPKKPPAPAKPATTGGIKGTVIFEGKAPERKQLVRDTDPYCEKVKKLSEDVVVTNGKLKDVLVRVKNGTGGKHAVPAQPVVFDQKECMYTPRVVGIVAGQKLGARNSDGTFHNVRGKIQPDKALWNKPHPAGEPELKLDTPAKPNDVVEVACDAHPWMRAYAVVQDHPYFAVSREDGTFEITGLAPGKYTLEAWHPTLGMKKMDIKIGTGAKATVPVRFTYAPAP